MKDLVMFNPQKSTLLVFIAVFCFSAQAMKLEDFLAEGLRDEKLPHSYGSKKFFEDVFKEFPMTKFLFAAQTRKEYKRFADEILKQQKKDFSKGEKIDARLAYTLKSAVDFKLVIACIERFKEKHELLPLDEYGFVWKELGEFGFYREREIGKRFFTLEPVDSFPSVLSLVNFAFTGRFEVRDEKVVRCFLENKKIALFPDWDCGFVQLPGTKKTISSVEYNLRSWNKCSKTWDRGKRLENQRRLYEAAEAAQERWEQYLRDDEEELFF